MSFIDVVFQWQGTLFTHTNVANGLIPHILQKNKANMTHYVYKIKNRVTERQTEFFVPQLVIQRFLCVFLIFYGCENPVLIWSTTLALFISRCTHIR